MLVKSNLKVNTNPWHQEGNCSPPSFSLTRTDGWLFTTAGWATGLWEGCGLGVGHCLTMVPCGKERLTGPHPEALGPHLASAHQPAHPHSDPQTLHLWNGGEPHTHPSLSMEMRGHENVEAHLCQAFRGLSGEGATCQCRRDKRLGFNLWVGKIPWRRKWPPIRFLAWEILWTEELGRL